MLPAPSRRAPVRRPLRLAALCLLGLALATAGARPAGAAPAAVELPEWTFLIFLNGKNNLDSYGFADLNEMERVGSSDRLNVVVQWGSLRNGDVRRLRVERDANPNVVTSPILESLGRRDMGDWRQLVEFIEWGVRRYPAKRYFIDVWDHGTGWHELKRAGARGVELGAQDISHDDETGNAITTEQLGQAIREAARIAGRRIDLYGSDACLMGMVEVAGEMRDDVEIFVGSQDLEPAEGWPYDYLLARWAADPTVGPRDVARILVEEFVRSYRGGSQGTNEVTLSAFDLTRTDRLHAAMRDFGAALRALPLAERVKVRRAAQLAIDFFYADYRDLLDFVAQLEAQAPVGLDPLAVAELRAAAGEYVIANGVTPGFARATGAAFWLPPLRSSLQQRVARYEGLVFDRETGWSGALRAIFE